MRQKHLSVQRCLRIRQKYFSVHGDTLKAFKRIFAVNEEYADRRKIEPVSANFGPKPTKFPILNHLCRHDGMGKKNHFNPVSL